MEMRVTFYDGDHVRYVRPSFPHKKQLIELITVA